MYQIEKKDYGYKLTFGDTIKKEEMEKWLAESQQVLNTAPATFNIYVDMRSLKPLAEDVQAVMIEGRKLYKQKGMQRSVVIVDRTTTKLQFTRLAKDTGIYEWERYIDASSHEDWEQAGVEWLVNAVDPDKVCC